MKTVLAGINAKYIHSSLGIRYLSAYTKDLNYNCKIMEFSINDNREKVIQQLVLEEPDLVGFSCYIWNIEYVLYIVNYLKLINPKCLILLGGPEVSYDSLEYLKNNPIDFIIEGEGEETYYELINGLLSSKHEIFYLDKNHLSNIKGLYSKINEEYFYVGNRDLLDINKVPFPYENLKGLENKVVYYEGSRGCPYFCSYCLSSTSHGVRFLNIERVKKNLDFFIENKVSMVKFVDRTFNCNKNFAMEIWSYLIEKNPDTKFHFEISADILDSEEIELLKRASVGLFQFEIGVQSTNNEVLKNINRFVNFNDIKDMVQELKLNKNIKLHLDLIAGLPGENLKSFETSFNDVYNLRSEEIQLGFLKLLKGSKMREDAEKWGMVYSKYPPYEIIKTNSLTYEDLFVLKRIEEVVDKYYNSNKFTEILNYFTSKYKAPFDFYKCLAMFFYKKGYYNKNISSADYYKVFIEFFNEYFNEDNLLIKEIVKLEYLRHNKKKWLPDFLIRDINKEMEKAIKGDIKSSNIEILKDCHIEKFFINIKLYLDSGVVEKGSYYILFNNQGDIFNYGGEGNFIIW